MKNESLEGCPRCGDYDKIKDELESNKRKSQDEQKNALKRCEDSKKQLQKKLMTIGAVAIVAGTILGKDFVDKIAEYIDSFNNVKDTASKLVGQADTPAPPQVAKEEKEETQEEIDDVFVLVPAPRKVNTDMWPAGMITTNDTSLDFLMDNYGSMSMIDLVTASTLATPIPLPFEEELMLPPSSLELWRLTTMVSPLQDEFQFFLPFDYEPTPTPLSFNQPAVVPETSTYIALAGLPLVLHRRKRRV
tara:strand:+ start:6114 stop:6854 length:741 start_codon:yes stop_codon:yes gene_type:complete